MLFFNDKFFYSVLQNVCLAILIAILSISCQNANTPLADPEVALTEPTWQLIAFEDAGSDRTPIDYDSVPSEKQNAAYTINFTKQPMNCTPPVSPCGDWSMEANGYPNQGELSYHLGSQEERSLAIYVHAVTEEAVPEGSKEPEFFDALKTAISYRINGTQLRIFYDEGKALLFEPVESEE